MSSIFYAREIYGSRTKILKYIGAYTDYEMFSDALDIVHSQIGHRDYIIEVKDIENYDIPSRVYYFTYYQGIKLEPDGNFSNLTFDIGVYYNRRIMRNSPVYSAREDEAKNGSIDEYIYNKNICFGTKDEDGDIFKYGKYRKGWSIECNELDVYAKSRRGLKNHVKSLLSKYFETRQ